MATTNTNTVRVTKAQKLAAIKDLIPENACVTFPGTDDKAAYMFDHAEILAFIDKELSLLSKKNSGSKKQTDEQKQREEQKQDIVAYLATLPEFDENDKPYPGATCTDVLKNVASLADYQVQKPSSLLAQLRDEGKVIITSVKGRSHFKLA